MAKKPLKKGSTPSKECAMWSCPSCLRLIRLPTKLGKMVPHHTTLRGYGHNAAASLLPACRPGSPGMWPHAALLWAQPRRAGPQPPAATVPLRARASAPTPPPLWSLHQRRMGPLGHTIRCIPHPAFRDVPSRDRCLTGAPVCLPPVKSSFFCQISQRTRLFTGVCLLS
jgi:hypothetical protein